MSGLDPFPSMADLRRLYRERMGRELPTDPSVAIATARAAGVIGPESERPTPIVWPVQFVVGWSRLISDNDKYGAAIVFGKPRLLMQATYREAKSAIKRALREQLGVVQLAARPIRLVANVYVPDRRPHDCANFAKLVHDAIQGAVIANDRWLYDVRWIRAGVDVDHPRAEITLSPLPQE